MLIILQMVKRRYTPTSSVHWHPAWSHSSRSNGCSYIPLGVWSTSGRRLTITRRPGWRSFVDDHRNVQSVPTARDSNRCSRRFTLDGGRISKGDSRDSRFYHAICTVNCICYMLSPVRLSVRLSGYLSHGWISQKRLKLGS